MEFLDHWRPRLLLYSRVLMWATIFVCVVVGFFATPPAWAQTVICITTGTVTLKPPPTEIFLKYGGPPSTYVVDLCGHAEPDDVVTFTTSSTPPNRVSINPRNFVLDDNNSTPRSSTQTVAVQVLNSRPRDIPFTVNIVHTGEADNPAFPATVRVTAYYSPPFAIPDIGLGALGQPLDINVVDNDIDRLGNGLALPTNPIVRQPFRGTATRVNNETIRYTPNSRAPRVDAFIYRVDDAIGNTANGTVVVIIAPFNLLTPHAFKVDPSTGTTGIVPTSEGNVEIDVPQLQGIDPESDVYCLYGEVESASTDVFDLPAPLNKYSGLNFYFQCYLNGEPLAEAALAQPAQLVIPVSDEYIRFRDLSHLVIGHLDGTTWSTAGVDNASGRGATLLSLTTSVFGEFAVFDGNGVLFPLLKRND